MRAPTAIAQAPEGKAEFRSQLARAFLAGAAILSASFANFLNYHDYPLVRLEVAQYQATIRSLRGQLERRSATAE